MRFRSMARKQKDDVNETERPEPEGEAQTAPAAGETGPEGAAGEGVEDERVAQLEADLAAMKDRYLRALADMENVRRRTEREKEDAHRYANEKLLSELLPVLDNFARAMEAAEQSSSFDALKDGINATRRQLQDTLTRAGLQQIQAAGQPFDPNLHEAIMQVEPREGQGPHEVAEELRAGYKLNDRVLRPTLVKVTTG